MTSTSFRIMGEQPEGREVTGANVRGGLVGTAGPAVLGNATCGLNVAV